MDAAEVDATEYDGNPTPAAIAPVPSAESTAAAGSAAAESHREQAAAAATAAAALPRRCGGRLQQPAPGARRLGLRVLIDHSLVEVFTSTGEVLSTRVYRGDSLAAPSTSAGAAATAPALSWAAAAAADVAVESSGGSHRAGSGAGLIELLSFRGGAAAARAQAWEMNSMWKLPAAVPTAAGKPPAGVPAPAGKLPVAVPEAAGKLAPMVVVEIMASAASAGVAEADPLMRALRAAAGAGEGADAPQAAAAAVGAAPAGAPAAFTAALSAKFAVAGASASPGGAGGADGSLAADQLTTLLSAALPVSSGNHSAALSVSSSGHSAAPSSSAGGDGGSAGASHTAGLSALNETAEERERRLQERERGTGITGFSGWDGPITIPAEVGSLGPWGRPGCRSLPASPSHLGPPGASCHPYPGLSSPMAPRPRPRFTGGAPQLQPRHVQLPPSLPSTPGRLRLPRAVPASPLRAGWAPAGGLALRVAAEGCREEARAEEEGEFAAGALMSPTLMSPRRTRVA